ncbi:hypothetical protein C789_960 [Microcystis aeruginosa FACHB-905 = DIANCHI905]|nr:hypothetical protein C789_960 [Microcystis aeruginosa FACHB-905 = DIANCHI905]
MPATLQLVSIQLISLASRENAPFSGLTTTFQVSIQLISLASREMGRVVYGCQ